MSVRTRLIHLERRQWQRDQGHCPHGVDIVDIHDPERPIPRCGTCGLIQHQIVIREDASGLPWSGLRQSTPPNTAEA